MKKNTALLGIFALGFSAAAQVTQIDEVNVTASSETELPVYHASAPRTTDVVHMDLKVSFDWDNSYLNGDATLTLTPHFYDLDTFVLDAQGMDIAKVERVGEGRSASLNYEYDGRKLRIAMGRTLSRRDTVKVRIVYTSKPNELEVEGGGAISEAKGLYFINPTNEEGGWMRQVWTQGEPTSNSAWFPTVDEPNERMTHEIAITVPSTYKTLSNGRLEFKTNNRDGSRTDFYLMDLPHAPYLVMMAVGEYAMASEEWRGIPVNYFVEPEYADVAKEVYPNTVEMLDFFSDKLGVEYPWQKYDQVTTREYVSGAMENTTGVIFGDFMYGDSLSWADGDGEDVVAHEMFHHWFGDYVTCESWANLPLNESFATYGEILWKEHKYGRDAAEWHAYNDLRGYMREFSFGKSEDMIRYDYSSVLSMFDGHSYAKGGRILHMLRRIIGDEAFFEGLRVYLEDNAYTAVEIHNLRLAFEKVTGLDLNWFFNQWFLAKGHPQLQIEHRFDRDAGQYILTVSQNQDLNEMPLYRLPVRVEVHTSLGVKDYEITVQRQREEFRFDVVAKPFLVHFDADQYLLAEIDDQKPDEFLLHQLANGDHILDRYEAIQALRNSTVIKLGTILNIGMRDKFAPIRNMSLNLVEELDDEWRGKVKASVEKLLADEEPSIRASAYRVWRNVYDEGDAEFYANATRTEISYGVRNAAFDGWWAKDSEAAYNYAKENVLKVRGSFRGALIRALLNDTEKTTPDDVIQLLQTAGPEVQSTLHLWLGNYLLDVNESDANRVLEEARNIHSYHESAKGYFGYGLRIAQSGIDRRMQNPELSSEDEEALNVRQTRLDALRASEQ